MYQLQFSLLIASLSNLTPLLPCLLCLHSERGRPFMGLSKAWQIKLRQGRASCLISRLGKVIQHGNMFTQGNKTPSTGSDLTVRTL